MMIPPLETTIFYSYMQLRLWDWKDSSNTFAGFDTIGNERLNPSVDILIKPNFQLSKSRITMPSASIYRLNCLVASICWSHWSCILHQYFMLQFFFFFFLHLETKPLVSFFIHLVHSFTFVESIFCTIFRFFVFFCIC